MAASSKPISSTSSNPPRPSTPQSAAANWFPNLVQIREPMSWLASPCPLGGRIYPGSNALSSEGRSQCRLPASVMSMHTTGIARTQHVSSVHVFVYLVARRPRQCERLSVPDTIGVSSLLPFATSQGTLRSGVMR
eukprot:1515952-Rhodomonas_salina.4